MAPDDPKTQVAPWDVADAGRRGRLTASGWLSALSLRGRRLLSEWAISEVAPGRLLPWLPVAFGSGIALYFAADREPAWWAASSLALVTVAITVMARRRPFGFPLALGIAAIAGGFCVATLQTARVAHPILQRATWRAQVEGFIEAREERDKSDRIVVRINRFDAPRVVEKPERVRVSVRKGTAPAVGSFVALKAHLSPPLQPLRPGGYDFARDMYFQQIGASGYVLGKIKTEPLPSAQSPWLRYASFVDGLREGINNRIHTVLPGDRGSIASALITGKRNAISQDVRNAFYISSLAHVLAISGFHMALVAGIMFFCVRASLALVPALAVQRPIKKWAALAALFAAAFYLLMSRASVSTQRSFIMIAIVLVGVMADRPAITFRTLAIAAFAVLLIAPQSVLHPSFQMSFSATLALIAGFQYGVPQWRSDGEPSAGARAALWGGREITGLLLASLVAGLATTPYAAYHFHRVAPYGVLANLLAMPVVSVVVMPMGILGVLTMPFGFDAMFWRLMGAGIDWMIGVAQWVTSLPGSVGHMAAFGAGPLIVVTLGLLLICLLHTPLRWSGVVLVVVAGLWALTVPRPDVLVLSDGQVAAVRSGDGRLTFLHSGRDRFAVKDWLAADGDPRDAKDKSLSDGVRCDAIGCTAKLANGQLVAFALAADAFEEDCTRAVVVVSPRESPLRHDDGDGQGGCKALLIDRSAWRAHGATALYRTPDGFRQQVAHPAGVDRPWARAMSQRQNRAQPIQRPATPDATPKVEDLDVGD